MTLADAQVIGPILTIIVGTIAGFMIRRADRYDAEQKEKREAESLAVRDRLDQERRDREAAERRSDAAQLEIRIGQRAKELADFQIAQLEIKRLTDEASHKETLARIAENTATTQEAVQGAKDAYHEANSVNVKIASLQGDIKETLTKIPAAIPSVGETEPILNAPTITGTFTGKVDP